jgi:predicted AlkP superfamily phosphohydrolase/phosphomutase
MLIGWDGAVADRVIQLAAQGKLPAVSSLLDKGIYAAHCLAPHPTMTPPNWTTIATGAWQGTHGITDFNAHYPGDPLLEVHQAFDARDSQAEYLWDAAARAGKRAIVLNWPTSYPAEPEGGVCVGGYGIGPNDWRYGVPEHVRDHEADIADEQLFSTDLHRDATIIQLAAAEGWQNVPQATSLVEAELVFRYRNAHRWINTQLTWHMLVVDGTGSGYNEVILSKSKDASQAFAHLRPGDWSPKLAQEFHTSDGPLTAEYRVKLEALEPDLADLRLYVTPLCNTNGWSFPPGTMGEIQSENGLPLPEAGFSAAALGWISPETYLELADMLHEWQVDATEHLLKSKPWDLFLVHYHLADITYHLYGRWMEPGFNADDPETYQEIETQAYQSLDRALGRTLQLADDDTLIILVGDHGCKPTTGDFHPAKLLVEAGLTVFKDAEPGEPVRSRRGLTSESGKDGSERKGVLDRTMAEVIEQGSGEVDWSKTKAVMQRSSYVYVNLKGRDPAGIVEPGEEYEQVREDIIKLLHGFSDPVTGKKPVVFALRKEDARMIGLWGDRVGDIVFGINGEFGRQHGAIVPTASYGRLSLETIFVMAGPGVKKGQKMERTIWLVDLVPTICYLAELPIPRDCEGAILYQALVNPEAKINELDRLRKQLRRVLGAQIM